MRPEDQVGRLRILNQRILLQPAEGAVQRGQGRDARRTVEALKTE